MALKMQRCQLVCDLARLQVDVSFVSLPEATLIAAYVGPVSLVQGYPEVQGTGSSGLHFPSFPRRICTLGALQALGLYIQV